MKLARCDVVWNQSTPSSSGKSSSSRVSTPARDAAKAMRDNRIGCVLVMDAEGRLSGIVTDRDFATRLTADFSLTDIPLSEIMTSNVVTATSDVRVSDILISWRQTASARSARRERRGNESSLLHRSGDSRRPDRGETCRFEQALAGRAEAARKTNFQGPRDPHTARAERRSEARSEQVLERFYHRIADHTGISRDVTPEITNTPSRHARDAD